MIQELYTRYCRLLIGVYEWIDIIFLNSFYLKIYLNNIVFIF